LLVKLFSELVNLPSDWPLMQPLNCSYPVLIGSGTSMQA